MDILRLRKDRLSVSGPSQIRIVWFETRLSHDCPANQGLSENRTDPVFPISVPSAPDPAFRGNKLFKSTSVIRSCGEIHMEKIDPEHSRHFIRQVAF